MFPESSESSPTILNFAGDAPDGFSNFPNRPLDVHPRKSRKKNVRALQQYKKNCGNLIKLMFLHPSKLLCYT